MAALSLEGAAFRVLADGAASRGDGSSRRPQGSVRASARPEDAARPEEPPAGAGANALHLEVGMTTTTEKDFEQAADATLRALDRALVDEPDLEVELSMGILSIEFADGTKFIVNSHRAARQIWMSADRAAWHFDLLAPGASAAEAKWVAAKTGDELHATLAASIAKRLGRDVQLR